MKKIIVLIATAALMSVAIVNPVNAQISADQPAKSVKTAKHHKKHHKVAHKKHHKVARHHHAKKRHA